SGAYAALVPELARYRGYVAQGGWSTLPEGPVLHPGDTTAQAPLLRRRLAAEQLLAAGDTTHLSRRYAGRVVTAVAHFQARHGLAVDSVVGPATWRALNVTAEHRVRQIEASLERLRWLPPRLGERHIEVNIPAFQLDAYTDGKRVLSMPVVVGAEYQGRATPIFADTMRYVVINPYWNVPESIAASELWPKQRRDPSYFRRNGYEVVHASWGTYVRQLPGPDNALGHIKFIFPNDFNVYLHDTPAQALFGDRVRAFSHGCVRVERPLALAQYVLGPQGWDSARVRDSIATARRERVDLKAGLPVYIIYLTATPALDGTMTFRNDLYDYDAKLLDQLAPDSGRDDAAIAWLARLAETPSTAAH
ncbi:MAG: L,D-transpeptidase family protein, partial [Candidatus Eremiobacteraeota bacterium]|nr:L,D-transpeptidase family protein [Candidatus Eremiobacteraeota bacterium]